MYVFTLPEIITKSRIENPSKHVHTIVLFEIETKRNVASEAKYN